jgi:23S rRNA (adenine2503-C2)-methyltransferase
LLPACKKHYPQDSRRKVTFEYIMLAGINDSMQHARELVKLLSHIPCKINLIRANDVADSEFHSPSQEKIDKFRQVLLDRGFNIITRKTRGADIAAACGQLAGKKSA